MPIRRLRAAMRNGRRSRPDEQDVVTTVTPERRWAGVEEDVDVATIGISRQQLAARVSKFHMFCPRPVPQESEPLYSWRFG